VRGRDLSNRCSHRSLGDAVCVDGGYLCGGREGGGGGGGGGVVGSTCGLGIHDGDARSDALSGSGHGGGGLLFAACKHGADGLASDGLVLGCDVCVRVRVCVCVCV